MDEGTTEPGKPGNQPAPESQTEAERRELFLDLFDKQTNAAKEQAQTSDSRSRPDTDPVNKTPNSPTHNRPTHSGSDDVLDMEPPRSPQTLRQSGLTLMQVSELVLKEIYLHGNLLGVDIARQIRLPFPIVDEALRILKTQKAIEVSSGDVIGTASYCFNLTELGTRRSREAFEKCRYVGPAPVSLEQYGQQCRLQTVSKIECSPSGLRRAMENMIVRDGLLAELGPAVCSGKSIFVYGPPGNGKTIIAKALGRFLNEFGGDIYIPYAIQTENAVITLLDPTIHQTTDDSELFSADDHAEDMIGQTIDRRWRRIRRPVVTAGGELTLEMLDLRYSKSSNFYTAPLHIKANGGVFLIDDFGRQLVSPRDLLNRWILPLEERVDFLTLATGKNIEVPFEQLTIFSTNIDPLELVDEAFLRRIRHKIRIDSPTRSVYTKIFRMTCEAKGLEYDEPTVDYLFDNFYNRGKPPRSSDPRDLLEILESICRFKRQPVVVCPEIIAEATQRFFCDME
jgi:hypothetical protein